MATDFDYGVLWLGAADKFKNYTPHNAPMDDCDQAAAAYLRQQIEAAFVERVYHDVYAQISDENIRHMEARAEAAEAEVARLKEALREIMKQDFWSTDEPDEIDGRCAEIARQALGDTQ